MLLTTAKMHFLRNQQTSDPSSDDTSRGSNLIFNIAAMAATFEKLFIAITESFLFKM